MSSINQQINDHLNAFCQDSQAYLQGKGDGTLSGLTFAAKDIFDVTGHVTGGGNPDWKATHQPAENNAWAVQVLVDAGATMVGKTITDELTRGIFGENAHYGTPINPRGSGRVPGGSSSGSASAVAGGLVDFALGSDTGGSVRVPASFCGLYGIRPTHGRISLDGMLLQSPSYDTIGWFSRDADIFSRVGSVLLQGEVGLTKVHRLIIATDALAVADEAVREALQFSIQKASTLAEEVGSERLAPKSLAEWSAQQTIRQGREAWEMTRDWIDQVNPRFSFEVSERYAGSRDITDAEVTAAKIEKRAVIKRMDALLNPESVICLPTTPSYAPLRDELTSTRSALRSRMSSISCIAGTIGAPQVTIPAAEVDGLPVGLSFIGTRGSDESLISFALQVARLLGV